jgi:hypothetical protein
MRTNNTTTGIEERDPIAVVVHARRDKANTFI